MTETRKILPEKISLEDIEGSESADTGIPLENIQAVEEVKQEDLKQQGIIPVSQAIVPVPQQKTSKVKRFLHVLGRGAVKTLSTIGEQSLYQTEPTQVQIESLPSGEYRKIETHVKEAPHVKIIEEKTFTGKTPQGPWVLQNTRYTQQRKPLQLAATFKTGYIQNMLNGANLAHEVTSFQRIQPNVPRGVRYPRLPRPMGRNSPSSLFLPRNMFVTLQQFSNPFSRPVWGRPNFSPVNFVQGRPVKVNFQIKRKEVRRHDK
jgi:hypothetical protein